MARRKRNRGKRNPPVATEAYRQRSAKLIEVAQGEPMLLKDIADTLGTTYGGAQAQMTILKKCGLPVPKVLRAKHNGFKDDVKMPPNMREKISYRYPSYLQAMSWRPIEMENGEIGIAYLLW